MCKYGKDKVIKELEYYLCGLLILNVENDNA